MDIVTAIRTRKSIRAYLDKPVPRAIIWEILDVAIRSTSASNTQPWRFAVITGKALDEVRRENEVAFISGATPSSDFPPKPYTPLYQERRAALAAELLRLQGISRDDTEKRKMHQGKGLRFYDAPAAVIVAVDGSMSDARGQFDMGCVCETICLAALNHGLGTIIALVPILYPSIIRKYTGIPESWKLSASVVMGYPDPDAPVNSIRTSREAVDNVTTWLGFSQQAA
jgi:nitroreductase